MIITNIIIIIIMILLLLLLLLIFLILYLLYSDQRDDALLSWLHGGWLRRRYRWPRYRAPENKMFFGSSRSLQRKRAKAARHRAPRSCAQILPEDKRARRECIHFTRHS